MKQVAKYRKQPVSGDLQTWAEREFEELERVVNKIGDRIFVGSGTPLNNVVANVGSIFLRTDGGASTSLYVKESGDGASTGWVAK